MIKTAIFGADTPDGGELIRLLAMHPEVEIIGIQSEKLEGKKVTDHHHGLIGEVNKNFVSTIDLDKCDVVFICSPDFSDSEILQLRRARPDLRVVILHARPGIDRDEAGIVYGLPEINRKLLVRGATAAEVPESFATMALVALFPFALESLLSGDISIRVNAPASIVEETDTDAALKEIKTIVSAIQNDYKGSISLSASTGKTRRSALMEIEFNSSLNLQQILDLYEIYDDHNFTFVTTSPIGVSEVAGTNKCIISISRNPDGRTTLTVAADCRLRGAAGEAVHAMNLLFGLHEKTGLALKAGDFEPI